ncbi:hypothetical protein EBO15_41980 [Actinomadura harenae]|uniref:Uncharacterized protein n=1 Tax=Actinomadura harenae TaxID=2483351 RepID=A0A3M2L445_9ACTN|nr:hypothetical protein EBO15_41980 [Actinomadura harenae]
MSYVDRVDEATYHVWPATDQAAALEREQWALYVEWNQRYEAAVAEPGDHPGQGGVDARYDELESLLTPHRQAPADARHLLTEWRFGPGPRYQLEGIDTWVRWSSSR